MTRLASWWRGLGSARVRQLLVVVLLVGGALRVGWVVHAGASPHFLGDPEAYLLQGQTIARGHGYTNPLIDIQNAAREQRHEAPLPRQPASFYPPGYPAFVGGVAWVVWHTPIRDTAIVGSVEIAQAVLGILSILLVFVLARRAFGEGVALTAAAMTAVYPNLITTTAALQLESVFIFLSLMALVVLQPLASGEARGIGRVLIGGALVGAVALVRPTIGLLLLAVVATWLLARRPVRHIAVGFVAMAIAMLAVVAPWTVRNAVNLHAFVPVSTGIGPALCMARNPEADGSLSIPILDRECRPKATPRQTASQFDVAVNRYSTSRAISWVKHHPLAEVRMWFTRTHRAYAHNTSGLDDFRSHMSAGAYRVVARVSDIASYVVIALAVAGAVVGVRRRRPEAVFLVASAVAYAIVPAILFGDPRYRVPADPLFVILSAAALGAAFTAVRRRAPAAPAD